MSSKTLSKKLRQSRKETDLVAVFAKVRQFVAFKFPELASAVMRACPEIRRTTSSSRAYAHVGHMRHQRGDYVCIHPATANLPLQYQIGVILHEFGHLGSGEGDDVADRWIFENFGIAIEYRGPKTLEWVPKSALSVITG